MSDEESFLARWSRRKRGAAPNTREQPKPKTADGGAQSEASAAAPPGTTQSPFDPASLPPIESIGAGSDIRAFLAAGVPAELTRAALRRAWSADPTIRDFIGLSENSWDFNAPGGVPGFGSVTAEEVRRLLAQGVAEPEAADPAPPAAEAGPTGQARVPASDSDPVAHVPAQDQSRQDQDFTADKRDLTPRGKENSAVQHKLGKREDYPTLPRRPHGGALPE